jgi:DNA-binding response OmpR family regulator
MNSSTPIADTAATKRPLRIVALDDEPFVAEWMEMFFNLIFPGSTVVRFTNSQEAFTELMRESPDLFTTDWHHAGFQCGDMLLSLAEKKVKYPILVIAAHEHQSIKAAKDGFDSRTRYH